jgi:hypothetical protein
MTRAIDKKASNARAFEGAKPNGKKKLFCLEVWSECNSTQKTTER